MSDKCIACEQPLNFTAQLILSSRGSSPRKQHSSKVIGVCDSCCNPSSPFFIKFKQAVGVFLWMNRNAHRDKLETMPEAETAPDHKSAAAGE